MSLFYLFFLLITHVVQECAEMIWAEGANDIEGCSDSIDIIPENNRKESQMTAELRAAVGKGCRRRPEGSSR